MGAGVVTGAVVAGPIGALTGGLIGAGAITVHLLVSHPQATLEPGTTLVFMLTDPLYLSRGSTAATDSAERAPAKLPLEPREFSFMADIQTVGVVGAGTMGSGIAHVFARAGFSVLLCDVDQRFLDRALTQIRTNLGREAPRASCPKPRSNRRSPASSPPSTAKHCVRRTLPLRLHQNASNSSRKSSAPSTASCHESAVLATNTSSISITKLAAQTSRPQSVIGMHFFNPVPVMALVEIVRGLATSDATFQAPSTTLAVKLGKTPVEVNDAPGFVSNRVLMPLINEAAFAVMEGVATAEAVDQVFKLGMAHPMGPLTLADFIGLDVCVDIMRVLQEGYGDPKYRPCPLLVKMVDAGWLGRKSGRGFYQYEG